MWCCTLSATSRNWWRASASPLLAPKKGRAAALGVWNSDVVEAAGDLSGYVGRPRLGVAEHVLDEPTALHAGDGVLDPDPDPRQPAVAAFFRLGQVAPARLFFLGRQS